MIADDFTGALDTGVQFAKRGIRTQVFTKQKLSREDVKPETEVLVVDTESRPMSPQAAYEAVNSIAKWAVRHGVEMIYKKTDSALRGNIGAELQAAADADSKETIHFFPAHPAIGRVTKDGVHYIDGELLENSVFGKDPFEPVKKSYIPDIIAQQSEISAVCVKKQEKAQEVLNSNPGVLIYDAETQEDISRRLDELLAMGSLKLVAGCAALADCLVDKISFHHAEKKSYEQTEGLYVACGSLNRITQNQVEYAAQNCGFVNRHLTAQQKLDKNYYDTPQGREFLEEIIKLCRTEKKIIVDTFDLNEEDKNEFLKSHGISPEQVRVLIANAHGRIVEEIANHRLNMTVLMTGGDTLMGYMKLIGCTQLEPVCEIEPGAAVSVLEWKGFRQQVISKSGGFGTEDILDKIAQKIVK